MNASGQILKAHARQRAGLVSLQRNVRGLALSSQSLTVPCPGHRHFARSGLKR